jgi:hypothetical protein
MWGGRVEDPTLLNSEAAWPIGSSLSTLLMRSRSRGPEYQRGKPSLVDVEKRSPVHARHCKRNVDGLWRRRNLRIRHHVHYAPAVRRRCSP